MEKGRGFEPPDSFLKRRPESTVLNLMGDYRYLTKGYCVSLHAEVNSCKVYPSVKIALDCYRAPIFMTLAKKFGFEVPSFKVKRMPKYEGGKILVPLNPYSKSFEVAKSRSQYYKYFKKLSMGRYPVLEIEPEGEIEHVDVYLTRARGENWKKKFAEKFFYTFEIPIARVFVLKNDDVVKPFYVSPLKVDKEFLLEVLANENSLLCRLV